MINPSRRLDSCKRLLPLIPAVLLAFGWWHLAGWEPWREVSQLRQELQILKREISALRHALIDIEAEAGDRSPCPEAVKELEEALPGWDQAELVLEKLERLLAGHSGCHPHLVTDEAGLHPAGYRYISMQLKGQGREKELLDLVGDLDHFPHLLLADSLHWETAEGDRAHLELQGQLVFFAPEDSLPGVFE